MSQLFTLLFSLIGLFWSANHLVTAATGIASHFRIPPMTIGLTVVAFATTSPVILVSILSSIYGDSELAMGDAIGSNIANIGLVLGLTILIRPLSLRAALLRREYPLLFLIMIFTYFLMIDGYLGVIDGCLLLLASIASVGYLLYLAHRKGNASYAREFNQLLKNTRSRKENAVSFIIGVTALPLSAYFLVQSATKIALHLGVSQLIIGLTIVSIGTSLPQLATSLMAAFKGQDDIAVGNILGSNMFNLLLVLAFPGMINPSNINKALLWRDIPIMFAVTAMLLLINHQEQQKLVRWQGGLLIVIYCCYLVSLILRAEA